MSMFIEDGTGKGYKAQVDDHNRLFVKSNVVSHMSHHTTYHNNAFSRVFHVTLQGTSETPVLHVTNNSSNNEFEIYWLRASSNANVELHIYGGGEYTSGGTSVDFMNTYIGHGKTAGDVSYEGGASGNLVVDTSAAPQFDGVYMGAYAPKEFLYDGGIVIPFGKSVTITATGANTNEIEIQFGFAIHSEGTRL